MDEWFANMGAFFNAFPDAPALAVDMALYGPPPDVAGYSLANSMLRTSDVINVYPPQE